MLFQKRKNPIMSLCVVAGASLVGGIALGITAHKYGPEIRSRMQGFVSGLENIDLNPFDNHPQQPQ
ncbi:MAG: hypothetical protein FWG14_09645 [Peptococcaceae bacterium]|nr:hypothetical protein [Peptococcaceae bacterium]